MNQTSRTAKEIDLGSGFGDVAVKANGVRIEIHADGSVAAYTQNDVDAYTNGAVHVHPAANDAAPQREPKIGDVMPSGHANAGWIYAGISKTTHQPFYVEAKDSGVCQWREAMAFAAGEGSRLPSRVELQQLYEARDKGALKGTFNLTGSSTAGWYWSSEGFGPDGGTWGQRFSDGQQVIIPRGNEHKNNISSLRRVR